ncbi:MAG: RNB domain-containing ribonuclease [Actinomycetota bacterium]|nr:RNB domain-containing ribonuclease [Actinomycetota bacterium]
MPPKKAKKKPLSKKAKAKKAAVRKAKLKRAGKGRKTKDIGKPRRKPGRAARKERAGESGGTPAGNRPEGNRDEGGREGRRPRGSFHVASLDRRGRFTVAQPVFEPGEQVSLDRKHRGAPGQMIWAEFTGGRARLVRELGRTDNARDVCEALTLERLRRRGFRDAIEAEAEEAARNPVELGIEREDLRDLPTFTVDPATARDFDDAVSARREGDLVRLWIHIADVAAYVRPGSALEREAAERANSTYVPTSVEPMLPLALSAGVCSLSPGEDRFAVTTEMVMDGEGDVRSVRFFRSLVRSDVRLDYDQLDRIFAGEERPPEVASDPLDLTRKIAATLAGRRAGGALEVTSTEPSFRFDSEGNVISARAEKQTEAHRLIEQLMVLNNEQVAAVLEARRTPTLYRVHEQPDPDRIARLFEQLASLDLPAPPLFDGFGPSQAGQMAVEASRSIAREAERRGHGAVPYASLILRSLKPARYSEKNLGHAGLGSEAYSHFTSPIRRYPDLLVHRGLLSGIGAGEDAPSAGEVAEAAVHCSDRERASTRLERDGDDVCSAFLLERELFEGGWNREFEGEVSGVIGAGAFVTFAGELGDVYEGFVPVRKIRGERFDLNEEETALIGGRTGRAVRFGDPVSVTVERIDPLRGRVDLEPADG